MRPNKWIYFFVLAAIAGVAYLSLCPSSKYSERKDDSSSEASFAVKQPTATSIMDDNDNNTDSFDRRSCLVAVKRLVELNVKLLAVDFDQTIVDVHTGGRWRGTSNDLASHVRPQLQCILQEAQKSNISTAVVTFSRQEELISNVVSEAIASSSVPVYGGNNSSSRKGKRTQIERAVSAMEGESVIPDNKIVLVDDDVNNIMRAQQDGIKAVVFNPDQPNAVFDKIKDLD